MQRLVLVLPTASYRASELLFAAERLGAEVVVASERRQAFAGSRPDRFLHVPLDDPEAAAEEIVRYAARIPVHGVVSVDDQGLFTAALAAQRLGLRHSPPAAVAATRDKVAMRSLLAAAGIPQPDFLVVAGEAGPKGAERPGAIDGEEGSGGVEAAERLSGGADAVTNAAGLIGWPVVVKPPTLSGSRGVIRADDAAQSRAAARRIRAILACAREPESTPLLVERFVPGAEVALDGLLRGGRLEVLALFDKPDPLDGPYFEETIYVTPSRLPLAVQRRAAEVVTAACAAIGLREGPVHAEVRVRDGDGEAVVLEVAARTIGGRCAKALRFATGASLDELVLAHALGIDAASSPPLEAGAAGVLMIPIPRTGRLESLEGTEEARSVTGVTGVELTIPIGRHVQALPEGDRYLGFVFARAETAAGVEATLRTAQAVLDVRIVADDPATDGHAWPTASNGATPSGHAASNGATPSMGVAPVAVRVATAG